MNIHIKKKKLNSSEVLTVDIQTAVSKFGKSIESIDFVLGERK